ncbi:MAG: lipoyl(octanoyl) transferase LipB [Sphingomonadales bacterium]
MKSITIIVTLVMIDNIGNIEVLKTKTLIDYEEAVSFMEDRISKIQSGEAPELLWFLEHPPLYTSGTSAESSDLLDANRFPVYESGRGGQYTYHGPGQRVVYVMLNLTERGKDVRGFVHNLEEWIIKTLKTFGITAEIREGRVGVWVVRENGTEDKVGAIGVRVRKWITYHGIAINVMPDLTHFTGIVPCGISAHGVTSFEGLGVDATLDDLDIALINNFGNYFKTN